MVKINRGGDLVERGTIGRGNVQELWGKARRLQNRANRGLVNRRLLARVNGEVVKPEEDIKVMNRANRGLVNGRFQTKGNRGRVNPEKEKDEVGDESGSRFQTNCIKIQAGSRIIRIKNACSR